MQANIAVFTSHVLAHSVQVMVLQGYASIEEHRFSRNTPFDAKATFDYQYWSKMYPCSQISI